MGRDKAGLLLDGRTLLEHALQVVREACGSAGILGSRELYGDYGAEVVEDIYPGCGPLGGIHAALSHSKTRFNLIIAVDTPFLSADFLRFMVERAVESAAVVTTPEIAGYRQPLCSVYGQDFLTIAEAALRGHRHTLTTETRRHGEKQIRDAGAERGKVERDDSRAKYGNQVSRLQNCPPLSRGLHFGHHRRRDAAVCLHRGDV